MTPVRLPAALGTVSAIAVTEGGPASLRPTGRTSWTASPERVRSALQSGMATRVELATVAGLQSVAPALCLVTLEPPLAAAVPGRPSWCAAPTPSTPPPTPTSPGPTSSSPPTARRGA